MKKLTLSVQELSEYLGISMPKAYELTKSAGFPVLRIGTRVLIPIYELHKWIAENAINKDNN